MEEGRRSLLLAQYSIILEKENSVTFLGALLATYPNPNPNPNRRQ
jgi:hypothetical protein